MPGNEQQAVLRAAAERQDATLAPALLQAAFLYCAEVLAPPALTALNRVELLRLLNEMIEVLLNSKTTLTAVTGPAFERAVAGGRLREALREGEARLADKARELAQAREALAPLLHQEETLRSQAAAYEELTQRHAELQRLASLIPYVDELPKQIEELAQRLARTGQAIRQREQEIAGQAQSLIVLSTAALAHLEPRARQALTEAEHLEAACRTATTQLHEAQARAQQLDSDLQQVNAQLRPHLEANQTVAQALPKELAPHALLNEAARLLRQADEALQKALATQAETQRLVKLPLMERAHERRA